MKTRLFSLGILLSGILLFVTLTSQDQSEEAPPPDNYECLKCHGKNYYSFENEVTGMKVHKKMNPYFILNHQKYNQGVHNSFACIDCHLPEYETYPHAAELKLEPQYGCMDCHGDDPNYAKFHFDEISIEVEGSVHGNALGDDFKCEMCHNPHYYELGYSKDKRIEEIVATANNMCTECHNYSQDKFYLLSDSCAGNQDITHSWLPSKELHFKSVRCIECHSTISDSLIVSHNIVEKESAVKNCVECHSTDSRLMSTLYKHRAKESRSKFGFINGAMMNESFVVGATKNYYLNVISIVLFSFVFLIILFHAFLRIILKK
ncbi:MAG: cytochrome c3 family protein [Bacteroidales bacterium]|nr:cytochrome c3 family protein [Bacteroidales bacterium]